MKIIFGKHVMKNTYKMLSTTPNYNHAMNNSCKMLSMTPTWKASNELHLKHVTSKNIGEHGCEA